MSTSKFIMLEVIFMYDKFIWPLYTFLYSKMTAVIITSL